MQSFASMEMVLIYPVFLGMSVAVAQMAHHRGYSARWWFLIATALPIISIFIVLFLKKKEKERTGYHAPVDNTNHDKVLFKKES
jgi:cytochrome bd-type quinol oxidase subunit 2